MRLLCALGLFLALLHVTSCLLIGAFNIQTFGEKKTGIKKPMTEAEKNTSKEVMEIITQIIDRYDIILIQEVRDKDWKVTNRLMDLVNEDIPNDSPDHFDNISSVYLPVSVSVSVSVPKRDDGYQERYLFLYKHNKVSVKDWFQYDEGKRGVFDRPPFVVKFSSTQTGVDFVLIPIHTQPLKYPKGGKNSTLQQLNALVDVVEAAKQKWKNNNIVVLGDFNAGSNYVRKGDWKKNIRLFTEKGFHSLIENVATTLAEQTIQTHDRIVISDEMNQGVVAGSAGVFDFIKAYDLKEAEKISENTRKRPRQSKTEKTSDHSPVEAKFISNHFPVEAKNISDHFPVEVRLDPELLDT